VDDKERSGLWNTAVSPTQYTSESEKYQQAIMEQYKTFAEMADRISNRRTLANTFFLTTNSAFVILVSPTLSGTSAGAGWKNLVMLALICQCVIWFSILGSYRRLSSAKYRIIGEIEDALPIKPWHHEWQIMGASKGLQRYWRLGYLERWVPGVFLIAYATALAVNLVNL
jgi:hypothetical protein